MTTSIDHEPTPFAAAAARVATGADHHAEAAELVAAMTADERLGCLDGDLPFWPGLADMTAGGYYRHPWPAAVVDRLGVPGIQFADGPRGAVITDGTAFPVSMARGALFDPALEERIGDAIGLELRAAGATFTGAVCLNLLRHPAWGRAQETYGEDPHHVGEMAAAFTRGLQRHVMACMKHFALNSMENARFTVDVTADERALHEVYLPHFRRVADEGVASTMSAYNSVNGAWCGENEALLSSILRDEWGWDGFVISDFIFGLRDAVRSVTAGLDIEMPFRQQRAVVLGDALADGSLEQRDVDRCVERIVATLLRFATVIDDAPDPAVIGSTPHRVLARESAAASMVLLRNDDGLLPVDPSAMSSIVVVGRLAAIPNLGDGGSSDVKATTTVTPLEGIRERFAGADVRHVETPGPGDDAALAAADLVVAVVGYTKEDEGEYIDNAGTMALAAELFPPMDHAELGFAAAPAAGAPQPVDQAGTEGPAAEELDELADEMDDSGMSRGGDRSSLRLRPADEDLIAHVAAVSDRVVVVMQCGSTVVTPWAESVPAVLYGWYAGVEGGHALADVLAGDAEPAGRLPFAVPTDESQLADFDKDATAAVYDLFHGQWLLDRAGDTAHFPFGWGLGYGTTSIESASIGANDGEVEVTVSRDGQRAGSTVVFVHAGMPESTVDRPEQRLVGFARVHLAPGERRSVAIPVEWSQLDVRRDGTWWSEPGTVRLVVGRHAGDPDAHALQVERAGSGSA